MCLERGGEMDSLYSGKRGETDAARKGREAMLQCAWRSDDRDEGWIWAGDTKVVVRDPAAPGYFLFLCFGATRTRLPGVTWDGAQLARSNGLVTLQ